MPPVPSPLPEPLVTFGGGNKFVYSDEESDDDELDSLPSTMELKQKVNEEDVESSESEDNSLECDTPE
ncbi:hypothetical protein RDI58_010356 [Solanum bulbocastanum]|uniref:Uncharacterized protein n=1 Tax=Solanum bulbocastanum TaxID=147425 RepID=A0AAN8YFY0_SOLBU